MTLQGNAAFEVDCTTSKGEMTVRVIAADKNQAHEEAIRVLQGDVISVLEIRDAPDQEVAQELQPEATATATADDPIQERELAREEGMHHDDMVEVYYEPCSQCGAELSGPVRLFPRESVPIYINCFKCHAGQGKSLEEQIAYQLGMRARPLATDLEAVLAAGA